MSWNPYLNPEELKRLFDTGIYSSDNPDGEIELKPFTVDDYGNRKSKLTPIGKGSTQFCFGSFQNPIKFRFLPNRMVDRQNSTETELVYYNLDDRDAKGNINAVLKVKESRDLNDPYKDSSDKVIEASRSLQKCQFDAIHENTKNKIEEIKLNPGLNDIKLQKALGKNWFYEDLDIDSLNSEVKKIKSPDQYLVNRYRSILLRNPNKPDDPCSVKVKAKMKLWVRGSDGNQKLIYPTSVYKVLNPDCKPDEKLHLRKYKFNDDSEIKILFNKEYIGWVQGYVGTFNGTKGWGSSYNVKDVNIIRALDVISRTGGMEVEVEKEAGNINDLFGLQTDNDRGNQSYEQRRDNPRPQQQAYVRRGNQVNQNYDTTTNPDAFGASLSGFEVNVEDDHVTGNKRKRGGGEGDLQPKRRKTE